MEPEHHRRRRPSLVAIAALVAVIGVAVAMDRRPPPAPAEGAVSSSCPGAGDAAAAARRFTFIGSESEPGSGRFTDDELRCIAASYDLVFITKFHAGFDRTLQQEDARRLKELNPKLQVFAYINTKFWHDQNNTAWNADNTDCADPDTCIDPDWLLRDVRGDVVPYTASRYDPDSEQLGQFVDEANPDYRAWILRVAEDWMQRAPFDGIYFDSADPIGDYGAKDVERWRDLLCGADEPTSGTPATDCARVRAYNDGITDLLRTATDTLTTADGDAARIFYNGFHPSDLKTPDRNLEQLDLTSGALDEFFCMTGAGEPTDVLPDLEIMRDHADRTLLFRVPQATLPGLDRAQTQRFCLGAFLMGWEPGSSYFREGSYNRGKGITALEPADVSVPLGDPTGPFERDGSLLSRQFEHGVVYVNLGDQPVTTSAPDDAVPQHDGERGRPVRAGDSVTVAPQDSVFLVTA